MAKMKVSKNKKRMEKYLAPSLGWDVEFTVEKAEGSYVTCEFGKTYLDWSSGTAVNITGHRHPKVMDAVKKQLDKLVHSGCVYQYDSLLDLCERLEKVTPGDIGMFFFSNSGAEAVEGCMKAAKFVTERNAIISYRGAFHGRTMGCVSVTTSNSKYTKHYTPLASIYRALYPHCYRCPLGLKLETCDIACFKQFEAITKYEVPKEDVAAVLIEPVQGEGGYVVPPKQYMQMLRKWCTANDVLLIFDEVQSGVARTGKWFAADHFGVTPDLLAIAKGIASGFPLSVVAGRPSVMKKWLPGAHGTTFGGSPVSCAASCATIDLIEKEKLLPKAIKNSEKMMKRLLALKDKYKFIGDIRGLGYMLAIEFADKNKTPDKAKCEEFLAKCLENGLIMIGCGADGNIVRILPAVTSTDKEIEEGMAIIENSMKQIAK